jgi:putative FmdB family regulatory protein
MPTYDFQCKKCEQVYEEMTPYDEKGKYPKVVCPHCGSKKKTKLVSTCHFQFANPEGTDRWNSDSSGHDYRFKHKQKDVLAEREAAQRASHMGSNVYNPINDLETPGVFGEAK